MSHFTNYLAKDQTWLISRSSDNTDSVPFHIEAWQRSKLRLNEVFFFVILKPPEISKEVNCLLTVSMSSGSVKVSSMTPDNDDLYLHPSNLHCYLDLSVLQLHTNPWCPVVFWYHHQTWRHIFISFFFKLQIFTVCNLYCFLYSCFYLYFVILSYDLLSYFSFNFAFYIWI